MSNESLGLSPASTNAGTNNKFIDLSNAIYNRHTHDKSMFVDVGEINCMIGIESIICSDSDRKMLYELISGNYCTLFDTNFVRSIIRLKKKDFIRICNYCYKDDTFSGMEFVVLKLLKKYHLKEFKRDVRAGSINKILELFISEDETKLIVKVHTNKCTADEPVLYAQSLLYLVLFCLYQHVNRHAYNYLKEHQMHRMLPVEDYVVWVVRSVLTYITPIITKVVYTISIIADDNYTWFTQLKQLSPAYGFLAKGKDENQVMFTFRPNEQYLTSTLYTPVVDEAPSDTNYSARFVECNYKLTKGNVLTCDTTILSKDMVDGIFATLIDEDDEPVSIFLRIADDEEVYLAHYSILKRLLSFMKQHEELKAQVRQKAQDYVATGKFRIISDISNRDKVQILTKTKTVEHAFKNIKVPTPDDKLIQIIREELRKQGTMNSHVDYIVIVLELLQEEQKVINETLAPLDDRTSSKIKKIITNVKRKAKKLAPGLTLNEFYKEW